MLEYIGDFESLEGKGMRKATNDRFNPICPHPSDTQEEKE